MRAVGPSVADFSSLVLVDGALITLVGGANANISNVRILEPGAVAGHATSVRQSQEIVSRWLGATASNSTLRTMSNARGDAAAEALSPLGVLPLQGWLQD